MTRTKLRLELFSFALAALALGACGDDSGPSMMMPGDGGVMMNTDAVPAIITLDVTPARAFYRTDQLIEVRATVLDAEGNEIPDAAFTLEYTPEERAERMGDAPQFNLVAEGPIDFTGCTVTAGAAGDPVCDTARILIDANAPILELTSPTPGAELGADGSEGILVAGSVADTRDVRVSVNGSPVELEEMGLFSTIVPGTFGVQHINVVASDGLGTEVRQELDVLWADEYRSAVSEEGYPTASFDPGLVLQLGQDFFDDGEPLDTEADPVVAQDLAGIFELVLTHLDLGGLLPDPLIDEPGTFTLRATDASIGDVDVQVDITDTGAEFFIRLTNIDIRTTGGLMIEGSALDLTGGVIASASAYAELIIERPSPEEAIGARIEGLTLALEDLTGDFASAEANAIVQLAEGVLATTLETQLVDSFGATLTELLPTLVTEAFGSLETLLADQEFVLDTGVLEPITLHLDGRLESIDGSAARWLRAPLSMQTQIMTEATHADSRGIADVVVPEDPPLYSSVPVQLSARLAVLNGLLHNLWNAGVLDLDATTLLPEEFAGIVDQAMVNARIAPIVRPAGGGEPEDDLILELGQLELRLTFLGDETLFGINLAGGARISADGSAISVSISETPDIRAWIIESTTPRPLIDEDALVELLETQLWGQLTSSLGEGLTFELPAFSVGDISGYAPDLGELSLQISLTDRLENREGYVLMDLGLEGQSTPVGTEPEMPPVE